MLEPATIKYLKALSRNNNKPWFDSHRLEYEAARIDFANFIQLVIDELAKTDPTIAGQEARQCVFRINRDIRFSNDKTPYKVHFGASIKRGGRKSPYAGYYFHLEPGKSFIGGGMWMPEAGVLKNIRQEIDYNLDEWEKIVSAKPFKSTYGGLDFDPSFTLTRNPKGFENDHPAEKYLRLKCFIAEKSLPDEDLYLSSLHRTTINAYKAIKPMLDFLNIAVGDIG